MKKYIIKAGLTLIVASSLFTFCAKEQDILVETETGQLSTSFRFVATALDTRTETDNGKDISWEAGDALAVFHSIAGKNKYDSNDKFTIAEENLEASLFTGDLQEELQEGQTYDWAVIYPYNSYYTTPANTTAYTSIGLQSKTINKFDDMSYLAGNNSPLVGIAKSVDSDQALSITLSNVASAAKIIIKNATKEELTVTAVSLTAPKAIVGDFYVNFADPENLVVTPKEGASYNTSSLSVKGAPAISPGREAAVYIPISPISLVNGDKLTIKVNTFEKTLVLSSDVDFSPGKIKTLNFSYNQAFNSENFYPASSISAGDRVIFSSGTSGSVSVMGHYSSGNNIPAVEGTVTNGKIASSASMGVFTVGGNATDGFTFYDEATNLYLNATKDISNYLKGISPVDEFAYWDVTFGQNGVVEALNKGTDKTAYHIRKNNSSALFSCYTTDQTPVYIFKYDSRTPVSLSFEKTEFEFTTNNYSTFKGQTVTTNPAVSGILYSIEGDDIGAIDATSGVVTLNGSEGKATVKASFAGNESYMADSASYDITVINASAKFYVKVKATTDLADGSYLIVYEAGSLAFNGGLETLDAVSNTISVTIANEKIESKKETEAAKFTISKNEGSYSILSSSGKYIGQNSDANGMASSDKPIANTISFDSDGNAIITSALAHLRYNTASNQARFRFYKSSSYTNQKAIQLYRLQ